MEHLVKKRGYTCIKWLCINNEPGAGFSWWQAPPNKPLSIGPAWRPSARPSTSAGCRSCRSPART